MSRARSSASANAAAGELATSGTPSAVRIVGRCRPPQHELRQQHSPFEPAQRRRQVERLGGQRAGCGLCKRDLVLVQVADGDDARQDRGAAPGHVEKEIAREPAGAARRQVERRAPQVRADRGPGVKPGTSVPSISARISVGTNGVEAGMVKTRGEAMPKYTWR